LILYHHGLGDIIQLTPHLRHLYKKGYITDLMCREQVKTSRLLDDCPYVDKLIEIINPWQSKSGFGRQKKLNVNKLNSLKKNYGWTAISSHNKMSTYRSKIDCNSTELKLGIGNKSLEVFISDSVERKALGYINSHYPDGYIHVHTNIEWHKNHTW
ncbi:unnamed protein product, partial [marine sediment metagenome]